MRYTDITRVADSSVHRGVVDWEEESSEYPYWRQVGEILIRGSGYKVWQLGDLVDVCGEQGILVAIDPFRNACSACLRIVILKVQAVGPLGTNKTIKITKPVRTYGESAGTSDQDVLIDQPAVFAIRTLGQKQIGANLNLPTDTTVCYLDRTVASQVRDNWHVHDGTDRYAIESRQAMERPDELPYLVLQRSSNPQS